MHCWKHRALPRSRINQLPQDCLGPSSLHNSFHQDATRVPPARDWAAMNKRVPGRGISSHLLCVSSSSSSSWCHARLFDELVNVIQKNQSIFRKWPFFHIALNCKRSTCLRRILMLCGGVTKLYINDVNSGRPIITIWNLCNIIVNFLTTRYRAKSVIPSRYIYRNNCATVGAKTTFARLSNLGASR